jgi:Holliday junction resolvase
MTPEGKVKDKIKKILKANGIYYAMPHGAGYGNAGVPDFLCCVKGTFLAIEAKAKGGKPTALQVKNMQEINDAGGVALVVDEDVLAKGTLEWIIKRIQTGGSDESNKTNL